MQDFNSDLLHKYDGFRVVWKLFSENWSGETHVQCFESESPLPERKFQLKVTDTPYSSIGEYRAL